jgi:GNAT superfamily N-acetyltransferase
MIFREANTGDIPQIQFVRNAVKENRLSNPSLVTDDDVADFITRRGRAWVCEINGAIAGFAIVDLVDSNVWALFVDPVHEGKGVGKRLHDEMLSWYFRQGMQDIWLSTAPGTRAERFYREAGWVETGVHGRGEIKFGLTRQQWLEGQTRSRT